MISIDEIRKRLQTEIKNSGLKQVQLANAIGVNETMVSQYMNHNKMPSLETFARICQFLDLDANEVLGVKKI